MKWTQEQDEQLIKLVRVDRLFASQIADIFQVSRNAVIGKVHRMAKKDPTVLLAGSPTKEVPLKKVGKEGRSRKGGGLVKKRKGKPRSTPFVKPVIEWIPPKGKTSGPITVLSREAWMCKYPIEHDEGATIFCGMPRQDWTSTSIDETAFPYCEKHHDLCYQPVSRSLKQRPYHAK